MVVKSSGPVILGLRNAEYLHCMAKRSRTPGDKRSTHMCSLSIPFQIESPVKITSVHLGRLSSRFQCVIMGIFAFGHGSLVLMKVKSVQLLIMLWRRNTFGCETLGPIMFWRSNWPSFFFSFLYFESHERLCKVLNKEMSAGLLTSKISLRHIAVRTVPSR